MGTVADAFRSLWRDYVVDLTPSSGKNEPSKSEIRDRLSELLDPVSPENMGVANGIATLGPNGLLADGQVPPSITGEIFDTTAAGIAATVDGQLFLVKGSGEVYGVLYKNVAEAAVSQGIELASKAQWDALQVLLEAQADVITSDIEFNENVLMATKDENGNVGGFLVWKDGRLETTSFLAGADGSIETNLFRTVDGEDGTFSVADNYGNVAFALSATGELLGSGLSGGSSGDDAVNVSPIVGSTFYLIPGLTLPFYPGNVLDERADPVPAIMAISSGRLAVEGSTELLIEPAKCDTTGRLTVRATADTTGNRYYLDLVMNIAAAASGQTVKYLLIGDSITKGAVPEAYLAMQVKAALVSAGYVSQACGTVLNTGDTVGNLHEGRSSRDMLDYVGGRITNMAPVTNDAAYIAGDAAYKAAHNPFLVAASGGADIFGTGWKVDFAQYRTRFSIPDPKFVAIALVTNSLIGVTLNDGIANILQGMDIWHTSIRADLPTATIAFYCTTIPRDPESDARHADKRAPTLRAMIERVRSYADTNCVLLNVHAQMSQEAGWASGDETTDSQTGVITSAPTSDLDNIHPRGYASAQVGRVLAAAAAYANLGA